MKQFEHVRQISSVFACLILSAMLVQAQSPTPPRLPAPYRPATNDFTDLACAVADLLDSRNPERFAACVTPSAEDWKSAVSTNLDAAKQELLTALQKRAPSERERMAASAKNVLETATRLKLEFPRTKWQARVIMPTSFGTMRFPAMQADESLPFTKSVEVVLEPNNVPNNATNQLFKLALQEVVKFPGGWRSCDKIQWAALPQAMMDDQTKLELLVLKKVADYSPITGEDDPALLRLGEVLVRFIQERDTNIFIQDAYVTSDLLWGIMPSSGRSREAFEKQLASQISANAEKAGSVTALMNKAGIDLKNATVKIEEAVVKQAQLEFRSGSIQGMTGDQFRLKLKVASEKKAKNGTPLAGEYILAARDLMRLGKEWRVREGIRWEQVPPGILAQQDAAKLEFENYVAQHRALPPGTAAPDIGFVTVDGEHKKRLSECKGKIVVLDFWATWCGPCQQPMAELQKLFMSHPEWKEKVAIVTISIDEKLEMVRKHLHKRGWTNTFNVWAGPGGWNSKPAKAFRVTGVPSTYIIDASGKIAAEGHPAALGVEQKVEDLLTQESGSNREHKQ